MADPFLGEIRIFGGNFAPSGWALCNGQSLAISQNAALFSILGTYYGGNGQTTFNLPDLQGRVPIGVGQGTGLSAHTIGQNAGVETTTLTANNLPAHAHTFAQNVSNTAAALADPAGSIPAVVGESRGSSGTPAYVNTAPTGTFPAQNTSTVGLNIPVSVVQPYLAISYIIALQGIYPTRS